MSKFYCYVDESGNETKGELFIVAVVLIEGARDTLSARLRNIELESGRDGRKWVKSSKSRRYAFMRLVFEQLAGEVQCHFRLFRNCGTDYRMMTIQAIADVIKVAGHRVSTTTILIDGLPKSQYRLYGTQLRKRHVRVRKVRGIRKEENDPIMRFADSIAGLVNHAEKSGSFKEVLDDGIKRGLIFSR